MEERRTINVFSRKAWRFVFAALIAGVGLVLFVLGFILPGGVWLTWLGFAIILAAIYIIAWLMRPTFPNFKWWWEQHYGDNSPRSRK